MYGVVYITHIHIHRYIMDNLQDLIDQLQDELDNVPQDIVPSPNGSTPHDDSVSEEWKKLMQYNEFKPANPVGILYITWFTIIIMTGIFVSIMINFVKAFM